jgi:cell division protein FtsQ
VTATEAPVKRDPRIWERRQKVQREAGHRRLSVIAAVALVVALGVTGLVLVHSSLFAARHVTVTGAVHTTAAQVLEASGLSTHPPLIDVGPTNAAAIDRLPWVEHATVTRHFPDGVSVVITERTPVAIASVTGQPRALVDASGRVLEDLSGTAKVPSGLVPVALGTTAPIPGDAVRGEAKAVVDAAAALPKSLLSTVVTVGTKPQDGIVVTLTTGALAILGTPSELQQKYVALATLLRAKVLTAGVSADLRVPSSPVLNP